MRESGESDRSGPRSFFAALNAIDGPCYYPTLLIQAGGSGLASGIGDELYANTVIAGTDVRAVYSWLESSGPLDFEGLPSDAGVEIAREIAYRCLANYGISLWHTVKHAQIGPRSI